MSWGLAVGVDMSVWVVQADMDDASDCQYIDYYSVYTFFIRVPYLIVFDLSESSFSYFMFTCISKFYYMMPTGGP